MSTSLVLFLIGFLAWAFLAVVFQRRIDKSPLQYGLYSSTAVWSLLYGIAFTLFPALHTGYLDISLSLVIFTLTQISLLILLFTRWWIDLESRVLMSCFIWTGAQLSETARTTLRVILGSMGIVILIYPIIVIATNVRHSGALPLVALRTAVATFGVVAVSVVASLTVICLASPWWRHETRFKMLLVFSSGIVNLFVILVLLLWSVGATGSGSHLSMLGVDITFSPRLALFVGMGICLVYVVPYSRGAIVGERVLRAQLEARTGLLDRMVAIFTFPVTQTCVGRLEALRLEMAGALESARQYDAVFGIDSKLSDPKFKPRKLKVLRDAFVHARQHDMRFEQLDYVAALLQSIDQALNQLRPIANANALIDETNRWAEFFKIRLVTQREEHAAMRSRKSPLQLTAMFFVSAILLAVLTKAGEGIWQLLSKSVG